MDDSDKNTHRVTNVAFVLWIEVKSGKDRSHGVFISAIGLNLLFKFKGHVDGSQIDFTLHFYPAYGVTGTSMFVGGEFLYRSQDSDVNQSFEISDFEVVGAACGADSFTLPCPSTHQRSYTSNLESKGMVDIFNNHVSRGTYGDSKLL